MTLNGTNSGASFLQNLNPMLVTGASMDEDYIRAGFDRMESLSHLARMRALYYTEGMDYIMRQIAQEMTQGLNALIVSASRNNLQNALIMIGNTRAYAAGLNVVAVSSTGLEEAAEAALASMAGQFIRAGASAYVPLVDGSQQEKADTILRLVFGLDTAVNGGTYVSKISLRLAEQRPGRRGGDPLTQREQEVLDYVTEGMQNKKIAGVLDVAENTVRAHIRSLMDKIGANNRTQLAIYGIHNGYSIGVHVTSPLKSLPPGSRLKQVGSGR